VDGYNPDGIQYDVDVVDHDGSAGMNIPAPTKVKADVAKIDDYIKKVASYKAGGDGGKCLKVLKAYVGNVVDNPEEEKFKTINMENKVFKVKVKPFIGAKQLLHAVGFTQNEAGDALVLNDDANIHILADTKDKLGKAIDSYG
jgi:UBX domain-containing protein 1/4